MSDQLGLRVFDVETTGTNPIEDRIVSAFFGMTEQGGEEFVYEREFLINPGVEVPEGASAVHGITTEAVRERGENPVLAVAAITDLVRACEDNPYAVLVAYNAPFDLTMLLAECERYDIKPPRIDAINVFDPFVVDKAIDRYRKGKRTLTVTAQHYGIEVDETKTHDAGYDCYLTLQLARIMLALPEVRRYMPGLTKAQARWKREQSESFQAYLRSSKNPNGADPDARIDPGWPVMEEWTNT